MGSNNEIIVPIERIVSHIYILRGKKVMLDKDLAKLYNVSTSNFNKAVTRNIDRFPEDFMFQLTKEEFILIFQNGTSRWGGTRKIPNAFTEQGVSMLSSVLRSKTAIQVNIQIIRSFVKLRELIGTNEALRLKIEEMEKKHDQNFVAVFDTLKLLIAEDARPKRQIGFN